jgi:hypothetical protein
MDLSSQPQRIILFGDQTESVLPAIQALYKLAPSSIYIQHFLRAFTDAARQSLEELCSKFDKIGFYFDSFLTLAEQSSQRQCPDVVVQTLLLCVSQLGHLILYVHPRSKSVNSHANNIDDNRKLEDDPECLHNATTVGWCTGLLPAVVAACSQSLVQVLQLTPETIRLAVRIGLEAYKRAETIETSDKSWARVVSGLTETEVSDALKRFNSTNVWPYNTCLIIY